MVGSTNYASVVLTLLVLLTPVKYGLFCLHRGASGWFFLLGGMLSFYWSSFHTFSSLSRSGARITQLQLPSSLLLLRLQQDCRPLPGPSQYHPIGMDWASGGDHRLCHWLLRHAFSGTSAPSHPMPCLHRFFTDGSSSDGASFAEPVLRQHPASTVRTSAVEKGSTAGIQSSGRLRDRSGCR